MKRFLLSFLFLLVTSQAYALDAQEVIWGFDGKAVPGRFNILSILLHNPTEHAYEGVLALSKNDGLGSRQGHSACSLLFGEGL